MAKKGTRQTASGKKSTGVKRGRPKKRPARVRDQPTKAGAKVAPSTTVSRPGMSKRRRTGTSKEGDRLAADVHGYTLKDRVRRAAEQQSEPAPTLVESEAVGYALSRPELIEEVREEAFVELAGVVERKLAAHGHPLTRFEAANVAWRILGR
jgi:hypothetical protein